MRAIDPDCFFWLSAGSLKEFGRLLNTIEDERDRMVSVLLGDKAVVNIFLSCCSWNEHQPHLLNQLIHSDRIKSVRQR